MDGEGPLISWRPKPNRVYPAFPYTQGGSCISRTSNGGHARANELPGALERLSGEARPLISQRTPEGTLAGRNTPMRQPG
eukprot:8980911-Alexandrium_andersonii.AAC.1